LIAKTSIVDRRPCIGVNCPMMNGAPFFPDKVFPEEVDNIKEYMKDTFTTNVNGFSLGNNGFGSKKYFIIII
jgi:hypothetical protein